MTIRLKKDGEIVHQEAKTFGSKATAREWAKRRETELEKPGAIEAQKHKGVSLGKVIDDLLILSREKFGRTRNTTLVFLKGQAIAEMDIVKITAADIIAHCTARVKSGTGGATVNQDVIFLRSAFKFGRSAMGLPISMSVVDDAAEMLRDNRVIHKPKKRDRRPTAEELEKLDGYYAGKYGKRAWRSKIPMRQIMWLAIYSCRRQDEICTLRLADIDWLHRVYKIRDMKSPDGSAGNHMEAHMPSDLGWIALKELAVIAEEAGGKVLVDFNNKSVSSSFTRACRFLGIEDLHFHDLRHEGASRLAEDGLTIPQIQQVTLHESWSSLSTYVNLPVRRGIRVDYVPVAI